MRYSTSVREARQEAELDLREQARCFGRALRVLRGLPPTDRRIFAECWWALLVCRLRLKYPKALRADRLVSGARTPVSGGSPTSHDEKRVLRLFASAHASHLLACSCLPRSLALAAVLRRHGIETRLEVGMRRGRGGLEGHAWLESGARVIVGDGTHVRSFQRFERVA